MSDLTPNDLSHLSEESFIALCPQGEHAPGPEPLSTAAQAVLDAYCTEADLRNRAVSDGEMLAAALRALANQVLPHSAWGPDDRDTPAFYRWSQKMKSRSWILNIAAELGGLQRMSESKQ